jgi:serine/threonine protein kinase/tetratricopeptide (TPR) repeat protein
MDLSIHEIKSILDETEIASQAQFESLLEKLPADNRPSDAESLLTFLIERKAVTNYQAQVILRGKGRSLRLGNYLIEEKLGQGGMGMVYRARHVSMKREIALKVVSSKMSKNPEMMQRFRREVEAAAKLNHPNIVVAHDASEDAGTAYLVMEYIDGKDLAAIVKKKGALKISQAVNFIHQTAIGLEYAHAQGVIHRDIKPSNLLLDRSGSVKILDMGLARIEEEEGAAELTATGAVMGTIDYMAPEQAVSTKHATAQSDVYSLGCTLWYLLVGQPIFGGESLMAKLLSHRSEPTPSLLAVRDDVSEELQAIFEKMVAKKAENRYRSMTEVVADLEKFRSGDSGLTATNTTFSSADDQLAEFLEDSTATLPSQRATAVSKKTRGSSSDTLEELVDTDTNQEFQSFMLPPIATGSPSRITRTRKPPWWQNWKITGSIAAGAGLIAIIILMAGNDDDSTPDSSFDFASSIPAADSPESPPINREPDIPVMPEPELLPATPAEEATTAETISESDLASDNATDGKFAREVYQFLIDKPEITEWKPLTVLDSKSERGAVLTAQPDGSLLASGDDLPGETYEVVVSFPEPEIHAIRLEVLPHSSLPRNGPGRHESGNFQISAFDVFRGEPGKRLFEERIPLTCVFTDHENVSTDVNIERMVKGEPGQYWHIWGQSGRPHFAVFIPARPIGVTPGDRLTIRITHRNGRDNVNLGCFRLTAAASAVDPRNEKLMLALRQNSFDETLAVAAAALIKGYPQPARKYLEKKPPQPRPDLQIGVQRLLQTLLWLELDDHEQTGHSYAELTEWMNENYFHSAPLRSLSLDVMEQAGKLARVSALREVDRQFLREQTERLRATIEKDPEKASVGTYYYLSVYLSQLGRWQEAADVDLELLKHHADDSFHWMRAAAHLLMADNEEMYRETSVGFLKAMGQISSPMIAERVCKIALLKPGAISLSRLPSRVLQQGLTDGRQGNDHWYRAAVALGAYREKKYRDSLNVIRTYANTPVSEFDALVLVVRAMDQFRLGDKKSAIETYRQAEALIPEKLRPLRSDDDNSVNYLERNVVNHDWLIAEILRREAEELIFTESNAR